jgi:hypothetical protein
MKARGNLELFLLTSLLNRVKKILISIESLYLQLIYQGVCGNTLLIGTWPRSLPLLAIDPKLRMLILIFDTDEQININFNIHKIEYPSNLKRWILFSMAQS